MSGPQGVRVSIRREEPLRRVAMSWEDYLALPERPRAEWVDGEALVAMTPVSHEHGRAVVRLSALLLSALPRLEVVTEVGLHLPRNRLRAPDVMVVDEPPEGPFVERPPVLVAEVLSPATRSEDTIRKSMEYAEGGVEHYWVVDPDLRAIDLWHNADGEWDLLGRVDDHAPTVEVEIAGVRIPIDLRQILGDRRTS